MVDPAAAGARPAALTAVPGSASLPRLTLVLGGARSGKSRHAERLIEAAGTRAFYVATAQAFDAEMTDRIALHKSRRGGLWETVEAPLDLAGTLTRIAAERRPILVDCLTLWLTNVMLGGHDVEAESAALAALLPRLGTPVVCVSNEVGLGIVPDNALARQFRDHAGRLNQAVASAASRVLFLVAGLPLTVKDSEAPHA